MSEHKHVKIGKHFNWKSIIRTVVEEDGSVGFEVEIGRNLYILAEVFHITDLRALIAKWEDVYGDSEGV